MKNQGDKKTKAQVAAVMKEFPNGSESFKSKKQLETFGKEMPDRVQEGVAYYNKLKKLLMSQVK